jgi:quercetin dioxygenase-like cupin family protein
LEANQQPKERKKMNPLTHLKKLYLLIAPALLALGMFTAVPASATDSCGVTTTNLLAPVPAGYFESGLLNLMCRNFMDRGLPPWMLMMRVRGDSDLYVNQLTFAPGAQAGWHTHPGPSLVTVTEGTLNVYHDDCTFETFTAGQSFTDIGCGDIHNVVNETGIEAKTISVQIVPHGAARREGTPDPGCPLVPPCPEL